jgi:hypothetical protein
MANKVFSSPWEKLMAKHLTGGAPISDAQMKALVNPNPPGLIPSDAGLSDEVKAPQVPADAIDYVLKAVLDPVTKSVKLIKVPTAQAAQK